METATMARTGSWFCFSLRCVLLLLAWKQGCAQIRYSIAEEVKDGTVVGNVAKDLGLDITSLTDRRFRVVSGSKEDLFAVNQNNGLLYVHGKIDREELCQGSGACLTKLKILVENPLEMHYVSVEITDVNDHAPIFSENQQTFEIGEITQPGRRFKLHAARDPDAGMNSIRTYTLTSNDHFELDISQSDDDKIPFLVLKKSLDREHTSNHSLVVTAVDGGKPPRSGTLNISVIVLDINDNRPRFLQDSYQVSIKENIPPGTVILLMNATDPDDGENGEIGYNFAKTLRKNIYERFDLDKLSGKITVKGLLDYEDSDIYKLDIEASDRGTPPLTGECSVIIKLIDVNDNPPEIELTSKSNIVSEDSKPGTVISLLSVTDKDSGPNGKIFTSIEANGPFELKSSYEENIYSVVTKGHLDREEVSLYEITVKATDCGEPPLSSFKTFSIQISDVNDNSPQFPQNPLQFYLLENNVAGMALFSVSAKDKDTNENAEISYHIARDRDSNNMLSFLNINSENGQITALRSVDFETVKTFQFQVVASDSGSPSLNSNVTVNVFILDQNDNAPVILYPVSSNGSAEGVEEVPRNVNAGHLVTKVRAYDADIGYNGWLLFSLQEVTDHSLFGLDRYTGQIRTLRSFTETDEAEHKLLILVKDNGNVSLSATATVIVKVVEPKEAFAASDVKSSAKDDEETDVTFYLMITLGSVSVLFLISIIVLIAMQCSKSTEYTSKYLQEANYDGTLCHSIQYRSGDKRYMLVGPRMSVGSTIVPGSHANTLVLPDRRNTSDEVRIITLKFVIFWTGTFSATAV
nr:protocadherin alpha-8-like [Nothobranchius furzeri]